MFPIKKTEGSSQKQFPHRKQVESSGQIFFFSFMVFPLGKKILRLTCLTHSYLSMGKDPCDEKELKIDNCMKFVDSSIYELHFSIISRRIF